MRNFFNSDSRLMKVLAKLFDIGYLSILFILFCIPIVTIGAALTALYYTTVKVIRHDRGYVSHEFWHAFKLNFFPATKLWIVQAVLFILIAFNISLVNENVTTTSSFMLGAYIVIGVIIYAVSCYAYPVLSRFNMKNMQDFKNVTVYDCQTHHFYNSTCNYKRGSSIPYCIPDSLSSSGTDSCSGTCIPGIFLPYGNCS